MAPSGDTVFTLGLYAGDTFQQVFDTDGDYVNYFAKEPHPWGQHLQFQQFVAALRASRKRSRTPPRGRYRDRLRFRSGKYKGETFADVYDANPAFVKWVQNFAFSPTGRMAEFKDYIARRRATAPEGVRERQDAGKRRAKAELLAFLKQKFEEYKGGYPDLQSFDQLKTGRDPFGDIIVEHGDAWMVSPNHKHYQEQEIWDPRLILEWGQTFHDEYTARFNIDGINRQKAAIELMLKQCFLLVKPNIKLKIYWTLQNRYLTYSQSIERVFGQVFADLEKRGGDRREPAAPPPNVNESKPSDFFGDGFIWSWSWPADTLVAVACKYYMWRRHEYEKMQESQKAHDKRVLLMQMLQVFYEAGDLEQVFSSDGSNALYNVPGGDTSILVEAPDEGAVHVFDRPSEVPFDEHRERIFALFRPFNSLVTRRQTFSDGSRYARVGDLVDLPDEFVAGSLAQDRMSRNARKKTKAEINHAVLDWHPEMKEALTTGSKEERPTLKDFLGWRQILTHRRRALAKGCFQDTLRMPAKRAEAVRKEVKARIKEARRKHAEKDGENQEPKASRSKERKAEKKGKRDRHKKEGKGKKGKDGSNKEGKGKTAKAKKESRNKDGPGKKVQKGNLKKDGKAKGKRAKAV